MARTSKGDERRRELAIALVKIVEEYGKLGGGKRPLTLEILAGLAGVRFGSELVPALNTTAAKKCLFVVSQKGGKGKYAPAPSSFVILKTDAQALAESRELLDFCLNRLRTGTNQLFTVVELRNALRGEALKKRFEGCLRQRLREGRLPTHVGALKRKNRFYLFNLSDMAIGVSAAPDDSRSTGAEAVEITSSSGVRFVDAFDEVFAHLDREQGNRNYVKLLALRNALPGFGRAEFDRELRELRVAGRYTLDASEGRFTSLTDEEMAAGIEEGGILLVYCSKR